MHGLGSEGGWEGLGGDGEGEGERRKSETERDGVGEEEEMGAKQKQDRGKRTDLSLESNRVWSFSIATVAGWRDLRPYTRVSGGRGDGGVSNDLNLKRSS